MMQIKKPLLSTYLFAGILLVGMVIMYILATNALKADNASIDPQSVQVTATTSGEPV
jgi:hypothetical protein